MELIHIKEKNNDTIIYLDHKKYYGYKYTGHNIQNIDNLDTIKVFFLSNDYTKLSNYKKYEVYLDNKTGLKHYFHNHVEDINLLFSNNGKYAINYLGNDNKLTNTKIFNLKNKIIICTFLGLMLAISNINKPDAKVIDTIHLLVDDYTLSDIEIMINASPYLDHAEKQYLYNEQFLTDVLRVVNDSYYGKNKLAECFTNINIVSFNDEEHESQAGYYKTDTPNTLYIKEYTTFDERKKGTIAHEFAHLCQDMYDYNLITEASADLITKEYFDEDYNFGYYKQVKLLKKIMEIIGGKPIWYYNFTGDFSKIEERVLPYLTSEEYERFLNDLSFSHDKDIESYKTNELKYKDLDEILSILYSRIYGENIEDDEIIKLINSDNKYLVRYYFNQAKINEDNSYYLDYEHGNYETISYKEAIDREIITPYIISYLEISNEAAFRIIEDDTYYLRRDINYHSHEISIHCSSHGSIKYTITATIDGIKYEDANVDDLVKDGIIDVTYYIIDRKYLTSSEYENKNYNDNEIYFIIKPYTIMNEDSIDYLVPQKVSLPLINMRYENNSQYTKKKKIT